MDINVRLHINLGINLGLELHISKLEAHISSQQNLRRIIRYINDARKLAAAYKLTPQH